MEKEKGPQNMKNEGRKKARKNEERKKGKNKLHGWE